MDQTVKKIKLSKMKYKHISEQLNNLYTEYKNDPIDLLGLNDGEGEYTYISNQTSYYTRTINDILNLFPEVKGQKILEIGAYLGVVSIQLAREGYCVEAADLEIFMQNKKLQKKYKNNSITYHAIDLKNSLPFRDGTYDCIILCETLEHLNFNPVPVIKELYRILKPEGYLYMALPNLAKLAHRINLIKGNSIHNPIADYFAQLDPKQNFSVGLHWKEYTKAELVELVEKVGFKLTLHKFFTAFDVYNLSLKFYIRALWKKRNARYVLCKMFPQLKDNHTIISQKPI